MEGIQKNLFPISPSIKNVRDIKNQNILKSSPPKIHLY